ncbi:MAG TPA: hypothetical protein V6C91_13860 [Coleofasciculaceae cyanobacterium]
MSYLLKKARIIILAVVALALTLTCTKSPAGTLATPYTNPDHFTKVPFGSHSHWLQPWRAYLETVPATSFLDGIGIQWNLEDAPNHELIAQMLAKNAIKRARVEMSWNHVDFEDETKLNPNSAANFRTDLLALKKQGIRPLILLNAHHGQPGPTKFVERSLSANARAGDKSVQLNDVSDLKVGYSGLSYLNDDKAAGLLITKISGNTVTLSKPLPKDIQAGTSVRIATLKYRPFSPPNTEDYKQTIAGWQRYVGTVAKFVANTLGTTQSNDKGFDMEIWNELSFGSYFLFINSYYEPELYDYEEHSIFNNLVKDTAAYVDAHPADFQGVLFTNGIANTIPWPASSTNPPRVTAISKHPYAGRKNYPQEERDSRPINALFEEDKSKFVPKYSAYFPEYFATVLQTETMVRDMGPIPSEISGTKHGRYAREVNGKVVPNPVWMTEINISPVEDNPNITAERALQVKAKTTARYLCFFLNKGVTQVHFFAIDGGDKGLGIVNDNFLKYAAQSNATYPDNDTSYTSPSLRVIKNLAAKMSQQVDPNLTNTRKVEVVSISDTHDHYQFAGDGTAAHPNLYNRDVFAFLPYQVNSKRFVIPYYVMTRDVTKDLPPEQFTVQIKGIKGNSASVTAYDPINDKNVRVSVTGKSADTLSVNLTATDYPYLLIVQEAT